jgi:hypothetical protein
LGEGQAGVALGEAPHDQFHVTLGFVDSEAVQSTLQFGHVHLGFVDALEAIECIVEVEVGAAG